MVTDFLFFRARAREQHTDKKRGRTPTDKGDFLNGNLQDKELYTLDQVDKLIEKHYGKGKGE